MTGIDIDEINSLKIFLNLGKLHYFLGLKILYMHDGVLVSQRKFTSNLLKHFVVQHFVVLNYKATTSPLDFTEKLKDTDGKILFDPTHYKKLVRKLNILPTPEWT